MRKKLLKVIAAAASLSMLSVCSLPAVEAYAVNDYGVSVLSADYSRQRLTANQMYYYNILGTAIDKIAAGEITKTEIAIPIDDVEGIWGNWSDITAAVKNDINIAFKYLMADKPQSIYWISKSTAIAVEFSGSMGGTGGSTITAITAKMFVASEYAASESFQTDPAKIAAAYNVLPKAQTIVNENSNLSSNYEKALAYKNAICGLVSYNTDAASNIGAYDSNAWQLIYVFDDVASTNVVCEGYSKAFQYLCDLGGIECYTVTGEMSTGGSREGHMWNIVRLDGKYYLVDVTNCDDSSVGAPDLLFLKSAAASSSTGCVFACNGKTVTYTYDSDTMTMYSPEILTVSTADYDPSASDPEENESEENKPGEGESEENKPGEGESEENKPGEGESEENKPGEGESEENKPGEGESEGNKPGEGESEGNKPEEGESEGNKPEEKSDSEKVAEAKTVIKDLGEVSFDGVPANRFEEWSGKDKTVKLVQKQCSARTDASVSYISHTVDINNKSVTFIFGISAGDEYDTAKVTFELGEPESDTPAPAPVPTPAPAPVVYGVSYTGSYSSSGVIVTGARTEGSSMTVTAPVGYEAVVISGNRVIARVSDGTAAFTMPAGNITVSVSSYLGAVNAGYKNAYIYSYDSDMNPIATNSVRGGMQSSEGEIKVKLGKKYAGRTVTLYSGRKSTSAKIDEAVLDSRGQAAFTVKSGKNYTLVVE